MCPSRLVTQGSEHRLPESDGGWKMQPNSSIPPRPGPSHWRPEPTSHNEVAIAGPHPSMETEARTEDAQHSHLAREWQSLVGQLGAPRRGPVSSIQVALLIKSQSCYSHSTAGGATKKPLQGPQADQALGMMHTFWGHIQVRAGASIWGEAQDSVCGWELGFSLEFDWALLGPCSWSLWTRDGPWIKLTGPLPVSVP